MKSEEQQKKSKALAKDSIPYSLSMTRRRHIGERVKSLVSLFFVFKVCFIIDYLKLRGHAWKKEDYYLQNMHYGKVHTVVLLYKLFNWR